MKKYLWLCLFLVGCTTSTNNVLANLSGGNTVTAFQAGCAIVNVAEGYFGNVQLKVTPEEASAVKAAEAIVASLCVTTPTNLNIAFDDLLSAWNVIQAGTTVPTATNTNPNVPPLVVKSVLN